MITAALSGAVRACVPGYTTASSHSTAIDRIVLDVYTRCSITCYPSLIPKGGWRPKRMRVHIDPERCQGHGRCYDLTPALFGADEEGYGTVLHDEFVPPELERGGRMSAANCPESAVVVTEGRP
jgi:ferredoxin